MSQAAPILREIKSIFNNQGITSDIQIASHLGFLLLIRGRWPDIQRAHPPELRQILEEEERGLEEQTVDAQQFITTLPQSPHHTFRDTSIRDIIRITELLEEALSQSPWGNIGDFFQYEIRFEILKDVRRESYPTPHHIADFIARLSLRHVDNPQIFDPAAGTGGLLAAALQHAPDAKLIGCDFDPNIAELGTANLLLHAPHGGLEFHQDSALTLVERRADYQGYFDSVFMNPPFGGTRSIQEATQLRYILHEDFGRGIHSLLTAVALHTLKLGGQAAFLLPTGTLFGSGGEERLRATLLQHHHLEAVITLNKELFQPYSGVAAHLMVVQKGDGVTPSANSIWFGDLIGDGYPSGAGRDLTAKQDPNANELPRMRELVLRTRAEDWHMSLLLAEGIQLNALLLQPADGLPGVAALLHGATMEKSQLIAVESGLLLSLEREDQEADSYEADTASLGWLYLPYANDQPITLLAEQVKAVSWTEIAPSERWSQALLTFKDPAWNGDNEAVSVQVADTSALVVETSGRGKQSYRFEAGDLAGPLACLFDSGGDALTPWLSLTDLNNVKSLQDDTFEKLSAQPILNANDERAGWVLSLSPKNETSDEATLPAASLVIVYDPVATLFRASLDQYAARLPAGWLRVNPEQQLLIETGEAVPLRTDPPPAGFAIGPAPTGSSEAHRVFAAAIPKEALSTTVNGREQADSFEPRRFLPEPPTEAVGHPSEIIANIRKNQARLGLQVDMLLNLLGGTSKENGVSQHPLLHLLEDNQQRFWQLLTDHERNSDKDPFYFTPDHASLRTADEPFDEDFIRQQIDLFVKMGLVEAVHMGEQNLYRLAPTAKEDELSL